MLPSEAFRADADDALITLAGYLPAGFPLEADYLAAAGELAACGFRILEIGVPPVEQGMDGVVIRRAMGRVAARGVDVCGALELGARASSLHGLAAVGMLYHSVLLDIGLTSCLGLFQRNAVHAILVPDMPASEWQTFAREAADRGIEPIGFIPPDADDGYIELVARSAGGFLYVPSYAGRTGLGFDQDGSLKARLQRVAAFARACPLPVAVGFGLRGPADVDAVRAMGAQGAVIGTALVEAAGRGREALRDFARGIASARGAGSCRR